MAKKKSITKTTTKGKAEGGKEKPTNATTLHYTPLESPKDFEQHKRDAQLFAHILASPDCPTHFRSLFGAVFSEMLGVALDCFTWPQILPLTYPVVRDICDAQNFCGTAEGLSLALTHAVDTLVPEALAEEARKAMDGAPKEGGE